MKNKTINFKGETFLRESELIGDVEKVTWFHKTNIGDKEIYTEDELNELEDFYTHMIIQEMTPSTII